MASPQRCNREPTALTELMQIYLPYGLSLHFSANKLVVFEFSFTFLFTAGKNTVFYNSTQFLRVFKWCQALSQVLIPLLLALSSNSIQNSSLSARHVLLRERGRRQPNWSLLLIYPASCLFCI